MGRQPNCRWLDQRNDPVGKIQGTQIPRLRFLHTTNNWIKQASIYQIIWVKVILYNQLLKCMTWKLFRTYVQSWSYREIRFRNRLFIQICPAAESSFQVVNTSSTPSRMFLIFIKSFKFWLRFHEMMVSSLIKIYKNIKNFSSKTTHFSPRFIILGNFWVGLGWKNRLGGQELRSVLKMRLRVVQTQLKPFYFWSQCRKESETTYNDERSLLVEVDLWRHK